MAKDFADISRLTEAAEMNASTKRDSVAKMVKAWESKNARRALKGTALSTMAVTLAACGSEDTTPFAQSDIDTAVAAANTAAAVAQATAVAAETAKVTAAETAKTAAETKAASDVAAAEAARDAALTAQATAEAARDAALTAQATAEAALAAQTTTITNAGFADLDALIAAYNAVIAPVAVALSSLNAETLAGTAGNDTFTGTATFYDAADNIVDGSTTDNDTYTLTVTASNASADGTFTGGAAAGPGVEVGPNVTNVENVNIIAQSVAALEVFAGNMTGVTNLTVTRADLVVGDATIAGNKAVVVFGADAADVATVTTGAGTTNATVIQATTAGLTVNADTASGDVSVTGAATINASGQGTGDTLTVAVLSNATQDAKAVAVTTTAEDVVIGAFTGTINVNAASSKSVDLASAAGGATIVALGESGTVGAATTGIDVAGIDSSGVSITTSFVGTSTAMGAIDLTGTAATNDVATISAVGFNAIDNDTNAVDTLNLSGNGAAATFTMTGLAATTIAASGAHSVNLAGDESLFSGVTISGVNTLDLTAGTAGTIDGDSWGVTKVDLGFDNQNNAITVGSDANYEVTADQTTGLDFDFSSSANGNVTITAGDDNGASTAGGTIDLVALNANDGATSTGTLTIEASISNVTGTTLTVGALQNVVITGDEDVTFTGVVTAASVVASASSGIITMTGLTSGVATVTTGGGADAITVNDAATDHVVVTNAGNDTVTVTATQNGSFVTGAGNDTINVDDTGSYVVNAGVGNDTVVVSGDADAIMVGGDGTDILRVDATAQLHDNTNTAISGFETLDLDAALTLSAAQWANNTTMNISSSSGTPTLTLRSAGTETTGITIDASGLTADAGVTATITIAGTAFADTLTGSVLGETFTQTAGNDAIEGGSTGTDTMTLLAASTDVDGSASGDVMNGNAINLGSTAVDEATITAALGNHLGQGATAVAAGTATFTFANATAASAGAVNIAAVQTIGGIENVTGGTGEDYIIGSSANNVINGAGGDDYIDAGDGDDTITGAAGADSLTGGLGADTFVFDNPATSDTVTDFTTAVDGINISVAAIDVGGALAALLAGDVDGVAGSEAALAANVLVVANAAALTGASVAAATDAEELVYITATGALYLNTDGATAGGFTQIADFGAATVLAVTDVTYIA